VRFRDKWQADEGNYMAHLLQVGAGSGGIAVLDLLCRDPRINAVTIIEPDVYKPHNVERHLFPHAAVGEAKADLADRWLKSIRPDLAISVLPYNLLDPQRAESIAEAVNRADIGVCAVDNEEAKFHWDALMRRAGKPWTLGEVLSGGIGGFVHWFIPGGPCYGCVASHLQRSVTVDKPATPDYSQPGGPVHEVTIPASKASIGAIASLHAVITLQLLENGKPGASAAGETRSKPQVTPVADAPGSPKTFDPGFTSMLFTLQKVPDVFEEAFRPYKFRIPRSAECLICRANADAASTPEDIDVALDQALARLGNA